MLGLLGMLQLVIMMMLGLVLLGRLLGVPDREQMQWFLKLVNQLLLP